MKRLLFAAGWILIACAAPIETVSAQYPTKAVTIVVPFPPGGGTDTGARYLAQKLADRWGKPVIVENKPGAGGLIGADFVARAAPDGYTLLMGNLQTQAVNPSLQRKKMTYNPATAFAPISLVAELPLVLLVHPSIAAKNTKEFIALAKAKPNELTYSSAGNGSSTHLAASLFENASGTKLFHVPYKGGGPAMADLLAGHVNLTFLTVLESTPHIKSGKVRALAVTSNARTAALPDVPTIAESAVSGFFAISWIGLLAPNGTAREIVEKISKDVQELMATTEMRDKFIEQGAVPVGSTPAQFRTLIETDTQRYAKIIEEKNITAE